MLQIGPYQVLKELARGGMGVVYLAQGPAGEQVAIKLLLAAGLTDPEQLTRFQREAQALETLEHPGILRVRSHGVDRGRPFMVMDLLPGPTLADVVREEGALPAARVARYGRAMAAALAHAHSRGVVHRDLKPANVILRGDDPVLVDFGLVRLTGHDVSRLTQSGTIMGSPAYMPPEQADGLREIGPVADVYGLGATLYCLLSGRPPFEGTGVMGILKQVLMNAPAPPSKLRPGVDPALERVILRCMEKEPDQRFPSASALEQALAKLAAPARRSRRAPQQRASKPSPLKAALPALLTGVPALLLGAWFVLGRGEPEPPPSEQTSSTRADSEPADPALEGNPGPPHPEAQRLVEEAQELGEAGRLDEAEAKLTAALERDPLYALAYLKRGTARAGLGRPEEARRDYSEALQLAPSAEAYGRRGDVHRSLERFPEALADCDRSLQLDASNVTGLLARAMTRFEIGHYEDSIADLGHLLELDPQLARAYAIRGACHKELRRVEQAVPDYDRAISLDPSNPLYYRWRGTALTQLKRYEEALRDFDQALSLEPDSAGWLARAGALKALGRRSEAVEAYTEALRLDPTNARAFASRGLVHANLRDAAAALRDLERAVALAPSNPEYREKQGKTYASFGEHRRALDCYGEMLRLSPEDPDAYVALGQAKVNLGQTEEGMQDLERALRLDPRCVQALSDRGRVHLSLGRFLDSIADCDRALSLQPRAPALVLSTRGRAKHELGRYAAAVADYDRALELELEQNFAAQVRRLRAEAVSAGGAASFPKADHEQVQRWADEGLALARSGKFLEAIDTLDLVLSLKSNLPEVHRLRGQCLLSLDRFKEAIAAYDDADRLGGPDAKSYTNRGTAKLALGRHEDAIVDCDRALRLEPTLATPRINRARALEALGRHAEAIAEFDRALKLRLSPADVDAVRRERAEAAAKLGE